MPSFCPRNPLLSWEKMESCLTELTGPGKSIAILLHCNTAQKVFQETNPTQLGKNGELLKQS